MQFDHAKTRVWIDTEIGTEPSRAAALMFALLHPKLQVVGISLTGSQQDRRADEAMQVLKETNQTDVPIYTSEEISREQIEAVNPEDTMVFGALTNISKLVLDEADLGKLHIMAGAFRTVHFRGKSFTVDPNIKKDLDSARVVLTQYKDVTLITMGASAQLIADSVQHKQIIRASPFLAARIEGFSTYLKEHYGDAYASVALPDLLAICDVINMPSITREVVEFVIQPDGSFRPTEHLELNPEPIEEMIENPPTSPTPTVVHETIRTVNAYKVMGMFIDTLELSS